MSISKRWKKELIFSPCPGNRSGLSKAFWLCLQPFPSILFSSIYSTTPLAHVWLSFFVLCSFWLAILNTVRRSSWATVMCPGSKSHSAKKGTMLTEVVSKLEFFFKSTFLFFPSSSVNAPQLCFRASHIYFLVLNSFLSDVVLSNSWFHH